MIQYTTLAAMRVTIAATEMRIVFLVFFMICDFDCNFNVDVNADVD